MKHLRIAGIAHGPQLARVVRQTVQIHTYANRIRALARSAANTITVPSGTAHTTHTPESTTITPAPASTVVMSSAKTTARRIAAFATATKVHGATDSLRTALPGNAPAQADGVPTNGWRDALGSVGDGCRDLHGPQPNRS